MKRIDGNPSHQRMSKRHDVVTIRLAFERRALAKPSAGWNTRERDGPSTGAVGAHFEQTFNDAKPIRDRTTHATHVVPMLRIANDDFAESLVHAGLAKDEAAKEFAPVRAVYRRADAEKQGYWWS